MPRKIRGIRKHGKGFQAYVRVNGQFRSESFDLKTPLKEMQQWIADQREPRTAKAPSGTFAGDAATYLEKIAAMPSLSDRTYDIHLWVAAFGSKRRRSITSADIRGYRDAWLADGYAASTVNHRLRALSNLWTVLDGRRAPNPVREVPEAQEPDPSPRGISYALVRAILEQLPDRGYAKKGETRPAVSQTKARLRVMAWTGLTHVELGRLQRRDWDDVAGTLFVQRRGKGGGGASRTIPLTKEGRDAMKAYDRAGAWGPFQRSAVYQSFRRACGVVAGKKTTTSDEKRLLADLRPYDFRHAHATQLYRASGDAHAAAFILGHRSDKTSGRYVKAAVTERVQRAVRQFERSTRKRKVG